MKALGAAVANCGMGILPMVRCQRAHRAGIGETPILRASAATTPMLRMLAACGVVAGGVLMCGTAAGQTAPAAGGVATGAAPALYKDPSQPFDKRVADLLSRMSLKDKAVEILETVHENKALGIPAVQWWTEAIHGISRAGSATVFPQAIGMAASWDPALLKQVGDTIANEARAKLDPGGARYRGIILWAPTINMARDPRWGRIEETYGEDPYLTGRLAVGFIQGAQGDDPKYLKTVATPKHFAMHSQESQRMSRSFDCPEPVIRDYYFPAFRDAFVEGKATSVMAAFSGINQVPDAANFWLLTQVLRKEWGFQGAVSTDWGAVTQLVQQQHYATSLEQAVTAAINAGVDVIADSSNDLGTYEQQQNAPLAKAIVQAVTEHSLSQEVLDRAVSRNLMLRFRLGMFDPPALVPFPKPGANVVGSKENQALALKTALESMVLLKNNAAPRGSGFDRLLPLDLRRVDSIAVLGPYASNNYFGAYSGSPANPALTMVNALRAAVGDRVTVRTELSMDPEANAKAAQASTVVIFAGGLNGNLEREGVDRSTLDLPLDQTKLLERVVKANPLTIVLLECGSPVGLAAVRDLVPAIMVAWYPGEQGHVAAAQLLLGQANPSGKLPLTFYRAAADLPPLDDYDIRTDRTFNGHTYDGRTYMYAAKKPTYAFGAGLSYTTFAYRNFQVTPDTLDANGTLTATLDVANTGTMAGDEVVQLYFHVKQSNEVRPMRQLKGFQRVSIPAGQSRKVTISVPVASLGYWDAAAKAYVPDKGSYDIEVGSASDDVRATAQITVK